MTESDDKPKTATSGVPYVIDEKTLDLLRANPDLLEIHIKNVNRSLDLPAQEGAQKEQLKDSPSN